MIEFASLSDLSQKKIMVMLFIWTSVIEKIELINGFHISQPKPIDRLYRTGPHQPSGLGRKVKHQRIQF